MTDVVLFLVIFVQALAIVALVVTVVRQQATLFSAAMSRTPGEYRKLEEAKRVAPKPAPVIDEATALVLESVTSSDDAPGTPMPHGLGGD